MPALPSNTSTGTHAQVADEVGALAAQRNVSFLQLNLAPLRDVVRDGALWWVGGIGSAMREQTWKRAQVRPRPLIALMPRDSVLAGYLYLCSALLILCTATRFGGCGLCTQATCSMPSSCPYSTDSNPFLP